MDSSWSLRVAICWFCTSMACRFFLLSAKALVMFWFCSTRIATVWFCRANELLLVFWPSTNC